MLSGAEVSLCSSNWHTRQFSCVKQILSFLCTLCWYHHNWQRHCNHLHLSPCFGSLEHRIFHESSVEYIRCITYVAFICAQYKDFNPFLLQTICKHACIVRALYECAFVCIVYYAYSVKIWWSERETVIADMSEKKQKTHTPPSLYARMNTITHPFFRPRSFFLII